MPREMAQPISLYADRMGVAKLTKMTVAGVDLRPLWQTLISKLIEGAITAGEGLDLSLIAQLLGDKPAGLAIQKEILSSHPLFRSPCAAAKPRLRVLALAAPTDMGSNMPIEFLLDDSDIELLTLYVMPDVEWPTPLPDHDIAIVIASDSELEEQTFMQTFDMAFARRHAAALTGIADRIGLDYFTVDCAETRDGSLLIFEADNTAIVHDMDRPDIFPYKVPQMRRVFDAFAAMLDRRVRQRGERAA